MSKDDFDIHWPGTDIVKSRNNGFCLGFSDSPVNWVKYTAAAGASAKITAENERRRKEGKDHGTFYGISRKADELINHGGAYSRARARSKPKADTKASRLRAFLADGPKNGAELGELLGTTPKVIRALIEYDIEHGKVVLLRDQKPYRYALAEAA